MFTVYLLYSPDYEKIYTGFTSSLEARLRSHNELGVKGWTRRYRPWTLIHTEIFERKEQAIRREKELKSARCRKWIWSFVKERVKGLISAIGGREFDTPLRNRRIRLPADFTFLYII